MSYDRCLDVMLKTVKMSIWLDSVVSERSNPGEKKNQLPIKIGRGRYSGIYV